MVPFNRKLKYLQILEALFPKHIQIVIYIASILMFYALTRYRSRVYYGYLFIARFTKIHLSYEFTKIFKYVHAIVYVHVLIYIQRLWNRNTCIHWNTSVGVFIAVIRLKGTTRAGRECPLKSCYASECGYLCASVRYSHAAEYNCTSHERFVTRLNTFFGPDDRWSPISVFN